LAHADPSADWLACLTALRAEVVIAGPDGRRRSVPLSAFVRGAMETELAAPELLVAIRVPRYKPGARFGFHKICRKTGEFADAIGVVVADSARGCTCVTAGATLGRPLIMNTQAGHGMTADAASALLKAAGFAGDAYDLALHAAALKRACDEAFAT
jgi:carbon-monoxide dehydrogenase medium subunit